jgi:hypothetical protein
VLRRISTADDIRQALMSIFGYAIVAGIPSTADRSAFDWLACRYSSRVWRRIREESDEVAQRVKSVLGEHCPDSAISEIAAEYYALSLEDKWTRWRASHSAQVSVETEVDNLHHLAVAQESGSGVVLWGTSFCGTLFQKIALSRAGVPLTQLSSYDHGRSHLNTVVGAHIAQPMFCLPENRFLVDRIMIKDATDRTYLRRIGEVLRDNGCIWIACHGSRHQRNLPVTLLGKSARLPGGAPTMAMRYRAALLPAHTSRLGPFHYRVTLGPPMEFDSTIDRRDRIPAIVQDYADLLGQCLLEQPSSWNWSDAPMACGLA